MMITRNSFSIKSALRILVACISIAVLCLTLSACGGDSPWRFSPGAPERPAVLTALPGNGQVSLSWPAAGNAAGYNIYYSTTQGVTRTTGIKVATIISTSYIQTGLTNDTTYYFVVTAVNSSDESGESAVAIATPSLPGPYLQSDLEGVWNFNALVTGPGSGWMRGRLVVDGPGGVTFSVYQDSAGNLQPPASLFPQLYLSPNGSVRDGTAGNRRFLGDLSINRTMIVGTASTDGVSRILAILQKQVPGAVFTNAGDLQGFGSTGGGGRRFIYNQLSSGSSQEWESAAGQIGKDQKVQYTAFSAPSNPVRPGDKASILNIDANGIVTESMAAALPAPAVVIDRGVMSADKSVIVGTATDTSGSAPRYILRIYQMVNIIFNDPNIFVPADLAGAYGVHAVATGPSPFSATGSMTVSTSGTAAFSSYADSGGSTALPPATGLAMDASGNLTAAADASLRGKLSYFKELFVVTRNEAGGVYSLMIGLKR